MDPNQSSTSSHVTSEQRKAQQELRAILDGMGVTMPEREYLYALAWVESNFNWAAVGDAGASHGMFQAERDPGVSKEVQTQNAVARLRRSQDALATATPINDRAAAIDASIVAVRTRSIADRMRLLRADWQLPEGWLTKWINACNAIVSMFEQAASKEKSADAANNPGLKAQASVEKAAALGMLNKGEGLGVEAFIGWLGGQGAGIKLDALRTGQQALEARLGAGNVNWDPVIALDGGYGANAGQTKNIFGWGYDRLSGAVDAMGNIVQSVASGANAAAQGAGNFLSVALPVGGIIIGGGLAVWLLKNLFGKKSRRGQ
jgi:hypothetical protein